MLFLTTREDDTPSGVGIIRVSLKERKLLTNAPLQAHVQILLWDYAQKVMYAWWATTTAAGVLGTIDPATGKTLSTVATFRDLSSNPHWGASSTYDVNAGVVYASLINTTDDSRRNGVPMLVSVDLKTNSSKVVAKGGAYLPNIAI